MKFTEEELERIKKEKMEEIDRWLDNEYGCSYTRLEELHDFLIDRNMKFQDELERYKNIVDELETYLNEVPNNNASGFQTGRECLAEELLEILKGE